MNNVTPFRVIKGGKAPAKTMGDICRKYGAHAMDFSYRRGAGYSVTMELPDRYVYGEGPTLKDALNHAVKQI